MSKSILEIIAENQLTKSTFLDLGNCDVAEFPDSLWECVWIERLNLSNIYYNIDKQNWVRSLSGMSTYLLAENQIPLLSKLKNLKELHLGFVNFSKMSSFQSIPINLTIGLCLRGIGLNNLSRLTGLAKIKYLDISENSIDDYSFLSELKTIQYLDLSRNNKVQLKYLAKLPNLLTLDCSHCQVDDIDYLKDLTRLKKLSCDNNKIISINFISNLVNLESLSLNDNEIHNIEPISKLKKLKKLCIIGNKLNDISPLSNLKKISKLFLIKNNIENADAIGSLTNLKILYVGVNNISDFSFLMKLKLLEALIIGKNRLSLFPGEIFNNLPLLTEITIGENPINNIPVEIYKNNDKNLLYVLKDYFSSLSKPNEIFPLYEAKLLLVGRGHVGKSELAEALTDVDYKFVEGRKSTEGILIKDWHPIDCTTSEGEKINFKVNLWDFGGQEVYYGTHQFFLTKNSLYVLVWDARQEEDNQTFGYWLQAIGLLSERSPVLIVQNKSDERIKNVNQEDIKKEFPFIVGFYQTSCKYPDQYDFSRLRRDIIDQLMNIPHVGEPWNIHRIRVRKSLEQDERNFINENEYIMICRANGLKEDESEFLSDRLHALGIILHYRNDEVLHNTVILKPDWATTAFYKIIDSKLIKDNQKGNFSFSDLRKVWEEPEYVEKRSELLHLMKRFELCFQFQDQDRYIVPEICPTVPYFSMPLFDNSLQTIRLEYHYEFMPKSVITRFICRTHKSIKEEMFWRSGVVLDFSGTIAVIQASDLLKRLTLKLCGSAAKEVLFFLRKEIEYIHDTVKNPVVHEMIPCVCLECKDSEKPFMFKYETLIKFHEKGKKYITCEKSVEDIDIKWLTSGIIDSSQFASNGGFGFIKKKLLKNVSVTRKRVSKPEQKIVTNRVIKIFLASSSELGEDRKEFERFIYRETKALNETGVFLDLQMWEDFIDAMSQVSLQSEYNKAIAECDIFVSLFFTKVGKYTLEEFETAFKNFKMDNRPLIYTYFKNAPVNSNDINRNDINSKLDFQDTLKELNHFFTTYADIDDLKYQFKMQLDKIIPLLTK